MSFFESNRNTWSFIGVIIFLVVGTYNSVFINSQSTISSSDMKFVKRLDEIYGVADYNRASASTSQWQKLGGGAVQQVVKTSRSAPAQIERKNTDDKEQVISAAVQENLELNLVEVLNPKKWEKGLTQDKFSGALATNNGVIESLSVSLPNGEGLSVSFSEMSGNVFEYDINGELYSAMMYQVDTTSYMVTLTNGPMEGTRLKFVGKQSVEQEHANDQAVAESDSKDSRELGNNGSDTAQVAELEPATTVDEAFDRDAAIQQQAMQAQEASAQAGPGIYEQLQDQHERGILPETTQINEQG